MTLGSSYSYYMIQGLEPGTEHTVTINPIFGDIEGPVVTGRATTGECPAAGVAFSQGVLAPGWCHCCHCLFGDLFGAVGTSVGLGSSSPLQWPPAPSRC